MKPRNSFSPNGKRFWQGAGRSQGLVEFALAMPVLLMLLFAIIDFSLLFSAWLLIQNMSRQAVRYAVTGLYNPAYCVDNGAGPCKSSNLDLEAREREEAAMQDQARIPSIHDVAASFRAGLMVDNSATHQTDPGYLWVTVCSSRDDTGPQNKPDGQTDYITTTGKMGSAIYSDCQERVTGNTHEDPGAGGDSVTVMVDFNSPFVTPFLQLLSIFTPPGSPQTWTMTHLVSSQNGVVEKFRTSKFIPTPLFHGETLTWTYTPTDTSTFTPSLTFTDTSTFTATSTASATFTATATATRTPTNTRTPTRTFTSTFTPTSTVPTNTFTSTFTPTNTVPTNTFTRTYTPTNTIPTNTFTRTYTPTNTVPTNTFTRTYTPTNTIPTKTYTRTNTPTNTIPTNTYTRTFTPTYTVPTNTYTRTFTPTYTVPTNTYTPTYTRTRTFTPTNTVPTNTYTRTYTPTNTYTNTYTRTNTNTNTPHTPSPTSTPTPTSTRTPFPTSCGFDC